jgi:DNA invertase Pin-like site-specific DNA recombinase
MPSFLAYLLTPSPCSSAPALEEQERAAKEHAGDTPIAEVFQDEADAAYTYWFHRPAGKRLLDALKVGDTVIVPNCCSVWTGCGEHAIALGELVSRGAELIVLDYPNFSVSATNADMMVRSLKAMSLAEAHRRQEATAAGIAERKATGRRHTNHAPRGKKWVGRPGYKVAVMDRVVHTMTKIITRARDEYGLSWSKVSDHAEQAWAEYKGRQFSHSAFYEREWGISRCRRYYLAAKRGQLAG